MSNHVIDLNDHRPDPHNGGGAICLLCRHRFAAVVPVGVYEFECPKCGCMKSVFESWVVDEKNGIWTCDCGCDLFRVSRKDIYCANCGQVQVFPRD
jgi:hypothetical protein